MEIRTCWADEWRSHALHSSPRVGEVWQLQSSQALHVQAIRKRQPQGFSGIANRWALKDRISSSCGDLVSNMSMINTYRYEGYSKEPHKVRAGPYMPVDLGSWVRGREARTG